MGPSLSWCDDARGSGMDVFLGLSLFLSLSLFASLFSQGELNDKRRVTMFGKSDSWSPHFRRIVPWSGTGVTTLKSVSSLGTGNLRGVEILAK